MKPVKCEFGHHYDAEKYSECPHCAKEKENESNSETIEVEHNTIKPEAMKDLVSTVVIAPKKEKEKETDVEETPVMPEYLGRKLHTIPDDNGKTRVLSESESNPVTGVLVAIKGPHFGEAFPIYNGRNAISRSIEAKVQLNKDTMVSRESQMFIIFDGLNNKFYATSGDAAPLSYVNQQPVLQPIELEANAEIRVGQSILMFVPFLTNEFTWEEYKKGDQK